ncbi:MAG: quinohemoprotein ethanol dehydrogenase [Candidatus Binatota bacterium]|nr:quinohemoprotein ethanol dehydrogenase [Candidatus Binatota bacterium]
MKRTAALVALLTVALTAAACSLLRSSGTPEHATENEVAASGEEQMDEAGEAKSDAADAGMAEEKSAAPESGTQAKVAPDTKSGWKQESGEDEREALADRVREATEAIDDERLRNADENPADWVTHGGNYGEERFSSLDQVNADTVKNLELVWKFDVNTRRGLEATPIVVDGVMYTTANWSIVYAIDVRTGKQIWSYDPKVPKDVGQKACCDVVNRGVAVYKGKVYVGVLDGRLVALDAANGEVVWEIVTVDQKKPYTITAAPRVCNGKVIIGNGGSEFGVRGYVSAYDADTGKLAWRSYTVPGDPAEPFESDALKAAAETWKDADQWLKIGAGGTVWDSISYDPALQLVYVGTGNGVAWNRNIRSPGGGDNLYLASILALDVNTGEMRWHYQTTPGDTWDFDSAQHMLLTDLEIDGRTRKVLMQAAKNGFFYVLDRTTGELLSAKPFVEVTWAKKVDLKTGKPIEVKGIDYKKGLIQMKPTPFGGHNWQPMSYNPMTGLVYIPAQEVQGAFSPDMKFEYVEGQWNLGVDLGIFSGFTRKLASGHLLAWDPVKGREAWRAPYKTPWNGGTLTTAGNLVFEGTADGRFVAYRADNGKKLWEAPADGTGIIAAPITYTVDDVQYVSISAGWGGAFALVGGDAAAAAGVGPGGWVMTFALGKTPGAAAKVAEEPKGTDEAKAETMPYPKNNKEFVAGQALYHHWCAVCHGSAAVSGGVLPDLRRINPDKHAVFPLIVHNGIPGTGMPAFRDNISDDEIRLIHAYVNEQAKRTLKVSEAAAAH